MYLPFVQVVACGSGVCAYAKLHAKHRVVVAIHRIKCLDIVRTDHTIAIVAKEINLRVVDIGVGRRERCGVCARGRRRGT